jgi:hypothetical protein
MRQFSLPRLLLSGLIAGIVIDAIQYLLDSFVFSNNWDALAKLISPATDPASAPAFTLTATKIVALMQLVGLTAGMLTALLGALNSRRNDVSTARTAALAWLPTYGLVCIAIVLISRGGPDPTHPPLKLVHGIGFALSGLVGSWAGAWFGNWVYRESEQAAAQSPAQA